VLAVAALAVHVPLEWAGRALFDLPGIVAGMALTTAGVLVSLLWALGAVPATLRGLVVAAALCGVPAAICFAVPGLLIGAVPAAIVGLALYAAVLAAWRPAGLRAAWVYARGLQ
jgi:hypothetical protein